MLDDTLGKMIRKSVGGFLLTDFASFSPGGGLARLKSMFRNLYLKSWTSATKISFPKNLEKRYSARTSSDNLECGNFWNRDAFYNKN